MKHMILAVLALTLTFCGLTPVQTAKVATDVAQTVCDELDAKLQDEPDWVKYGCKAVDTTGKVVSVFSARVPKKEAPAFAAAYKSKK